MKFVHLLYTLGVVLASLVGFFSPFWYFGFGPLAIGLVWAAYDLVEVSDAESPPDSQR